MILSSWVYTCSSRSIELCLSGEAALSGIGSRRLKKILFKSRDLLALLYYWLFLVDFSVRLPRNVSSCICFRSRSICSENLPWKGVSWIELDLPGRSSFSAVIVAKFLEISSPSIWSSFDCFLVSKLFCFLEPTLAVKATFRDDWSMGEIFLEPTWFFRGDSKITTWESLLSFYIPLDIRFFRGGAFGNFASWSIDSRVLLIDFSYFSFILN